MAKSSHLTAKSGLDWRAVGRRIRELRGYDMTQTEVALRIGVTQGHLSSLERGDKEAGAAVLLAISREFGKSVDWLLTGKAHVEPRKRVGKDSARRGSTLSKLNQ